MILSKRPDIERFLAARRGHPRALIYGRDMGVVRDRGHALAAKLVPNPDDPFDVAILTEQDLADDGGRLEGELAAQSLMGGRRLVRLRMTAEKPAADRLAAEALERPRQGRAEPRRLLPDRGREPRPRVGAAQGGREGRRGGRHPLLRGRARRRGPAGARDPGQGWRVAEPGRAESVRGPHAQGAWRRAPGDRAAGALPRPRQRDDRHAGRPGTVSGRRARGLAAGTPPPTPSGGRLAEAQAGLRRAAQEGESGPAAVRALGIHLGRLRRTLTLAKAGAGLQEAAKASGVFWKQEREFLRQARAWTLADLDRVQPEILAADRACKTTGSPDRLIAERLALTVAGRARRLGL
jgi:DNA polymerase-3 subunit delta